MSNLNTIFVGYSDGDVDTNRSGNLTLESIVEARYSRRQTMFSGVAALTTAALGSSVLGACSGGDSGEGGDSNDLQVSAGSNGRTSSGRPVGLVGAASDGADSYRWEQISGPPVALANANTANASFIAPSVAASTPLAFRFTAKGPDAPAKDARTTVRVDPARLGFEAVAKNKLDRVTVPAGYTATVLYRTGDPIKPGASNYSNSGRDGDFDSRAGDHHDALYYFGLNAAGDARDDAGNSRGLLVMNHENITQIYLHANGPSPAPRPEAEALKEMEAHGVSGVEVLRSAAGSWRYDRASALNFRVTPLTELEMNGPARGSAQLRTAFSPDGTRGRGTINNCANGYTQWGTYLTCEENWAFYFRRDTGDNANRSPREIVSLDRNGIREGNSGNYAWSTVQPSDANSTIYARWNATVDAAAPADGGGDFRNEPNQFGWVVEIDPYDSSKAPRKRTALGRFAHEGAWPSRFVPGRRPAIYMGDDSRGEYLYKFVSATPWSAGDAQAPDRLSLGDKYLDAGTLYVARFDADGTGRWLPLVFGQGALTPGNAAYSFQSQADVLINARLAGDAVGATPMDRPEWTAINPHNGEMYLTLTNSNARARPLNGTDAANPRHYNDPKQEEGSTSSQVGNPNGHIIRLREHRNSSEAVGFAWDIYVFGAGADLDAAHVNISGLDASNDFSSPDGLWFARPTNASGAVTPVLWIQTDDGAYTDVTNNQMLAAMPGQVGDGYPTRINNVGEDGAMAAQRTFIGRPPRANLRRFLVGPIEAEITGIDTTPDGRSLFVNIQHPGEDGDLAEYTSNWPASQSADAPARARPRSGTVVITRDDGGVVGL